MPLTLRQKREQREFYNLMPEDEPVPLLCSTLAQENGKWYEIRPAGSKVTRRTATGSYIFVVSDNEIRVCRAGWRYAGQMIHYGHIDLAKGRPVQYAGQIKFSKHSKRGIMLVWDNKSGHYKPSADYAAQAAQAGLPTELFRAGKFTAYPQRGVVVSS